MKRSKRNIMQGIESVKSKIVANNTIEFTQQDGTRIIRLHNTNILIFKPDNSITFNTDGWKTVTTRDRMNRFQNKVRIYQAKKIWYATCNQESFIYKDGMVYRNGKLSGCGKLEVEQKRIKQAEKYASLCVSKLPLNPPGAGDCWYCVMKEINTGKPLDDCMKQNDHILTHIKEGYVVPSLVYNAMKEKGMGIAYMQSAFKTDQGKFFRDDDKWWKQSIKRAIKSYILLRT